MTWSTIEHDVDTHVTASSIEDPFLPLSLLFSFLFFFSSFFSSFSWVRTKARYVYFYRLLHSPPKVGGAKKIEPCFAAQFAVCKNSAKNQLKKTAFSAAKKVKEKIASRQKNIPTRAALRCFILNFTFFSAKD